MISPYQRLIQAFLVPLAMATMAWTTLVHADSMPPVSGVISIATEPVTIKTTSVEGKVSTRTVGVGQPIYLNDEIKTGPNNKLQILLKDQTVFNVGPNSVMTIDKFVFDPTKGELSVGIQKGAFKFVSGKVSNSNPDAMKVKLPNATISVRGTGVAGNVAPDGSSTVVLLHGVVDVAGTANNSTLSRSGWGVQVTPGGAVGQPAIIPLDVTRGIMGSVAQIKAPVSTASSATPLQGAGTTVLDSTAVDNKTVTSLPTSTASDANLAAPSSVKTQATLTTQAGTAASIISSAKAGTASGLMDYLNSIGVAVEVGADLNYVVKKLTPEQQQVIYDAKNDQWLLLLYPDDVVQNHFTPTYALDQQTVGLSSLANSTSLSNPYSIGQFNVSNFSGTTPHGFYKFDFSNIALGCMIGITCGSTATANLVSQSVVVNYDAATISNAYNINYSNFGIGNTLRTTSGSYTGSFSSPFTNLIHASSNTNAIVLPTDPTQTGLSMLATFGTRASGDAGASGVFSTAINTQIGTSSNASLQATYSGDGTTVTCFDGSCVDIDSYLSTYYPTKNFTAANVTTQIENSLQSAIIANNWVQDAYGPSQIAARGIGSAGPLQGLSFGVSNPLSITLSCLTGGNSCGNGASGTVTSVITINYAAGTLQNNYTYNIQNFGLGGAVINATGAGSPVSSFSNLTTSPSNGNLINLPIASNDQSLLKMLGSFIYNSTYQSHYGLFSAAVTTSAGSKTIALTGNSGIVNGLGK